MCRRGFTRQHIRIEGQPETIKDSGGNFAPLIYKFGIQQKAINQPQINVAVNVPRGRTGNL